MKSGTSSFSRLSILQGDGPPVLLYLVLLLVLSSLLRRIRFFLMLLKGRQGAGLLSFLWRDDIACRLFFNLKFEKLSPGNKIRSIGRAKRLIWCLVKWRNFW